jgi:hypothetical protein
VIARFAGQEPAEVVLDLVVGIEGTLCFGTRLREEVEVVELRQAERLIASLLPERESIAPSLGSLCAITVVAVVLMLPGAGDANCVDFGVADHARQRPDGGLIEVGLILISHR